MTYTVSARLRRLAYVTFLALQPFSAPAQTGAPARLPPAAQEALDKGVLAAKVPDYPLAIRFFEDARSNAPEAPVVFLNLGLAESRLPGRELRAIAWFGAYLSAYPGAPNAAAVRQQIDALEIRSLSNASRLIESVQNAAVLLPSGGSDRVSALDSAAQLWARIGDLSAARKAISLMADSSGIYSSSAWTSITWIQASQGDISGAQATAEAISRADYKNRAQRYVAEAHLANGDAAAAQSALRAARTTAGSIEDVQTRGYELGHIAEAQAKAGDIAGAEKTIAMFSGTQFGGFERTMASALYQLAKAHVAAGDSAGALASAERIQTHLRNSARGDIAKAQIAAGDLAGAQKTIDLLPDGHAKAQAQHPLGLAQVKAGDLAGAQRTAGLIKDDTYRRYVLEAIIDAQVQASQYALAIVSAKAIEPATMRDIALYNKVVVAQAAAGDIPGAQGTIEIIQAPIWKFFAQIKIAEVQAAKGDKPAANATLAVAQRTAELVKKEHTTSARSSIASVHALVGDIPGALRIIDSIPEPERDSSRSGVATAQARAGDVAGALRTADLAQSQYWKGFTRVYVARMQIEKGDLPGARRTLAEAQKAADLYVETNPRNPKKNLLRSIAEANAKAAGGGQAASVAEPPVKVADWVARLEATTGDGALNTRPFLDLPAYLKSLAVSDNPKRSFDALRKTAGTLVGAHNIITAMVKR